MSFRWYTKILVAFLLVIAVVIIPTTFYLGANLKSFLMDQKEEELKRELKLAAYILSEQISNSRYDSSKIQALTNQVSLSLQRRVTIISKDGRVLGDSGLTPEAVVKLDDHSYRPEIMDAKTRGYGQSIRFSTTMQSSTLYAAVPIFQNGSSFGYLRLALPLSQIEKIIDDSRWRLTLVGGVTSLLAIVLSFFLTWEINRPLREVTDMVKRMADGDLKQPFHLLPKSEFSALKSSLERMAKELLEKMELLDTETGQLKTLLSNMQEGVMITDDKGRIILMNPFLEEVLGKKISWKKRTVQEIFMISELQEAVETVMKGNPFQRLQLIIGRAPQRHFEVQVIPLIFSDRHRLAVAILHETTELRHLLKVRQDFVANASHELRTPLTAINGALETMLSLLPANDPDAAKFLSILQKNVRGMNYLVSDLLDLAKLEGQERSEMFLDEVNVTEVLKSALRSVSDLAEEKNISLSLDLSAIAEDCSLFWERDRVQQAVFNLLDNAVKYTPPGGSVRLSAREADQSLVISVTDTGLGIPKEHLARIFERFYRVDRGRSRELGGTGLGLSIVKHIVEAHKGTVEAHSELGRGSTFTSTFPKKNPGI